MDGLDYEAFAEWQMECGDFIVRWMETAETPCITLVAIDPAVGATVAQTFDGPGAAVEWAARQQDRGRNCYFEVNETRPDCAKKPPKSAIVATVCRHSDIDPLDDQYPFAEERARLFKLANVLAADPDVAPTVVIDSGNGIQCLWVTVREANSAAVTGRVEAENKAIDAALGGDTTFNIDRLLRLPGTLNFPNKKKFAKGRQVARASVLSSSDRVYSAAQAAALGAQIEPLVQGLVRTKPTAGKADPKAAADDDINKLIGELRAAGADKIRDADGLTAVLRMSLQAALVTNTALSDRWAGRIDDLGNDRSSFDFSVACLAKMSGFAPLEAGLILCGCVHSKANFDAWPRPADRLRHVARCVLRSAEPKEQEEWLPKGYFSTAAGIWFQSDEPKAKTTFVCGQFVPVAGTSDEHDKAHGTLLQWTLDSGRIQRWPVPHRLLHDSGNAIAAELADAGLKCAPGTAAHERLKNLIFRIQPAKHIRSVARSGWHRIGDDDIYVMPSGEVFGKDGVEVIVHTAGVKTGESTQASGTLAEWQYNIARHAVGNSRVAFGISTAFAAPLLDIVNEKSGGFNATGASQIGKTYGIAQTAASVCGRANSKDGYIRSWNATQSGLEIICAETCDLALILDELGQADKKNLESMIYQIFNESGKGRMARTADAARKQHNWRLIVLSTGEKTVEQHLAALGL
jgi:hypothetical protein